MPRAHHSRDAGRIPLPDPAAKELTRIFGLVNVLPFGIQGGAAALMVTVSHETPAEGIMAAGLPLQIIMFRIFAATAVIFK